MLEVVLVVRSTRRITVIIIHFVVIFIELDIGACWSENEVDLLRDVSGRPHLHEHTTNHYKIHQQKKRTNGRAMRDSERECGPEALWIPFSGATCSCLALLERESSLERFMRLSLLRWRTEKLPEDVRVARSPIE